jgi:heme-degrading monooxygenase HmoA
MHARFGVIEVRDGQVEEAVRIFRDSMVPPARTQKGFKGATVLAERTSNKLTLISFWETEADARAMSTTDAAFNAQADKLKDILTQPPDIQYLEVMYQE